MTSPEPAQGAERPLVCIHGYSDSSKGFAQWKKRLAGAVPPITTIRIGNYISLTNEVTIKDIARAMNRALKDQGIDEDTEFDAIVHSTGMLVIRSWLVTYPKQRERLKHLIALAPATNGSPLAHKGRSVLGSIFKGNKELGPDFLAVGDEILDALELGSRFTWELAANDLFGDVQYYGVGGRTPYVFIFCGNEPYSGLRKLVNEPGTDGTVRWSGCSLNSRRVSLDLTRAPGTHRASIGDWHNVTNVPLIFCDGLNHGTIMAEPPDWLVEMVITALRVESEEQLTTWRDRVAELTKAATPEQWQQFVVRVTDERGDPVTDYSITLHAKRRGQSQDKLIDEFETDIHSYARDNSLRNFHVSLTKLFGAADGAGGDIERLGIEFTASTGSKWVHYEGTSDAPVPIPLTEPAEVWIDLTPVLTGKDKDGRPFTFFYPFTTTFVDIQVNRVPGPDLYTF